MFVSGFFHKPIVADAVREVVPCGLCPHNSIKRFKNMKITKEDLQKIVQEEFEKEIQEQQLTEKQVEEIFGGKLRSKANTAYNTVKDKLLGKKPTAPATQTTRSQPQIARFTQGPSSDPTQSQATTSSTVPSAAGAATQTAGPGETATTATTQPATEQPAAPPAPAAIQPETPPAAAQQAPAAQNPKLMKRMELFKQNMPQYFQAIQKKIADVIKGAVSANVQQIKEAADPSSVISSLISKELNNALAGALKTVTPEDFLKAYQMVAKKNIKDPKQLAQSLKNFRGLEEQETVDVNPLAGTEMDLFDAVLQAKRIGISSLVKQAAEKALANPQVQRYMPPEQATKVVASLTSAARTVRQLLAMNPASTAQTIAKSAPAATPPAQPAAQPKAAAPAKKPAKKPAAQAQQPSPVAESYKATYDKWKKIIKG
jgi:hypothetical protein